MAEQENILAAYQIEPKVTVYLMDTCLRGVPPEELARRDRTFRDTVERLMEPYLLED